MSAPLVLLSCVSTATAAPLLTAASISPQRPRHQWRLLGRRYACLFSYSPQVHPRFSLSLYTASKELGSPAVIYERLKEVSSKSRVCMEPISHDGQSCGPIDGNYKGSYLKNIE